jgi:hypothetical protein
VRGFLFSAEQSKKLVHAGRPAPRAAPDAKTKKYIVSVVFRDKIIRYFNCFQNCPTLIKPRSEAVASIAGLCSTLGHIATPSYQARFKDFWRD